MRNLIKKIINRYFNIGLKSFKLESCANTTTKIAQLNLYLNYKKMLENEHFLPKLQEVGFKCFSQFEEDGLILFIFAIIGENNKIFIDIGSGDGINSNCANLAINWGWFGLFLDGNAESIVNGKKYYNDHPNTWACPPKFCNAFLKAENINKVISDQGFSGEVDFLSIDIDGNDFWIFNALTCISPRVVMIEAHVEFGYNSIVVPYNPDYVYPGSIHPDYHGASVPAMKKLFKSKGYRLVGSNAYGFNLIFIREDICGVHFPEITVEELLGHPRNLERMKKFEIVSNLEYIYI